MREETRKKLKKISEEIDKIEEEKWKQISETSQLSAGIMEKQIRERREWFESVLSQLERQTELLEENNALLKEILELLRESQWVGNLGSQPPNTRDC